MAKKSFAVAMLLAPCVSANCDVDPSTRQDCGHVGTQQSDCEASGCCWKPASSDADLFLTSNLKDTPWCFHPGSGPTPPPKPTGDCGTYDWSATSPGFTSEFETNMLNLYLKNLNIQGSGAVVAAPDHNTPGGSYYYHWMRDGALSMDVFMDLNDRDLTKIQENMDSYVKWVKNVQSKKDDNNDVRIEPKFEIPSGNPYTGGWCRPQTDGPGLRARTLSHYGSVLVKAGSTDQANDVFALVANDMDWVTNNWQSNGCDLWEEARNTDFFWGRMGFVDSLKAAADFAKSINQNDLATKYLSTADDIKQTLNKHWNGTYLTESDNGDTYHTHGIDGATIHALASFPNSVYGATSKETAATVKNHINAFCDEYHINRIDNGAKIPGILIGRYPGDHYANGNPWQLLSAVLGELFYNGASSMQTEIENAGNDFTLSDSNEAHKAWKEVLNLGENATASDFVSASMGAGDSVLTRVYTHVKNDGGRIDEQIDKETGVQMSAKTLTWSHANVLHALHVRKALVKQMENGEAKQEFIQ